MRGALSTASDLTDTPHANPRPPAGAAWRHEIPRRNRGFAKAMRRNPTEAEQKLWLLLKNRRFAEYKFRRQVPIGPFIADFVCYSRRLIVELDGSPHAGSAADEHRAATLAEKGFATIRVWNSDLTTNPDGVADAIWHKLEERAHG